MATKLRALLQQDKGRDLFDLAHALVVFQDLNIGRVIELFGAYLARTNLRISRAEAEQRMFAKLARPAFIPARTPRSAVLNWSARPRRALHAEQRTSSFPCSMPATSNGFPQGLHFQRVGGAAVDM